MGQPANRRELLESIVVTTLVGGRDRADRDARICSSSGRRARPPRAVRPPNVGAPVAVPAVAAELVYVSFARQARSKTLSPWRRMRACARPSSVIGQAAKSRSMRSSRSRFEGI